MIINVLSFFIQNILSVDPIAKTCTLEGSRGGGQVYQFDAAFGPESTTEKVYEDVGSVVVEAVLEGPDNKTI